MPATRVLLLTRNFPPLWGGMERLNWHLAEELSRRFAVRVIAPKGAARHAPSGVAVHEVPLAPLSRFVLAGALAGWRQARAFRPDVVLAGSGLTAPLALLAARACGARTAAYVHGLDVVVPHPVYRALWLPALRRIDRVIANSAPTAQLARNAGVDAARIGIVHPGVTIPEPDPAARARFRQRWGLPEHAPVLLSVGRLTARKGLREFVQEVLPTIVRARPDVVLAIVGDAPAHALYAQPQTAQSILHAARAAGVADRIRLIGKLFGPELADAYFGADLHVFPVRDLPGDPEGFGMVAVEAAAHGLPTVAYATGGVVDAVAPGESGWLAPPGDAAGFAAATLRALDAPPGAERCRAFAQGFAWEAFGRGIERELSSAQD
jgi:phosphatidylinositol alpha-1,6-mannosyltransferase